MASNHICTNHQFPFSGFWVLFSYICQAYEVVQSLGSKFLSKKVIYNVTAVGPHTVRINLIPCFSQFYFIIYLSLIPSPFLVQSTQTHTHTHAHTQGPQPLGFILMSQGCGSPTPPGARIPTSVVPLTGEPNAGPVTQLESLG